MASVRSKGSSKDRRKQEMVQSRLRNPLNVVVDRISKTRAMVQGDVSVESLRELLMSSLSLMPPIERPLADLPASGGSDPADSKTEVRGEPDAGIDRSPEKAVEETDQPVISGLPDREMRRIVEDQKRKSKKSRPRDYDERIEPKRSRTDYSDSKSAPGRKLGIGSERRSEEEEEEEDEESLKSCPSSLGTEEYPFSSDSRWLCDHLGSALIQGLKNLASNKPEDPVSCLAFFLREYRSLEEIRRRRKAFDSDLETQRLAGSGDPKLEYPQPDGSFGEPQGDLEEDEEGGGTEDSDFKNYRN